jgi:hypothetical protein
VSCGSGGRKAAVARHLLVVLIAGLTSERFDRGEVNRQGIGGTRRCEAVGEPEPLDVSDGVFRGSDSDRGPCVVKVQCGQRVRASSVRVRSGSPGGSDPTMSATVTAASDCRQAACASAIRAAIPQALRH